MKDLRLIRGKKVLFQTKAIEDRKSMVLNRSILIIFGIAIIILLIIGCYYLNPNEEYPK